jgi:hypothetical protein
MHLESRGGPKQLHAAKTPSELGGEPLSCLDKMLSPHAKNVFRSGLKVSWRTARKALSGSNIRVYRASVWSGLRRVQGERKCEAKPAVLNGLNRFTVEFSSFDKRAAHSPGVTTNRLNNHFIERVRHEQVMS